MMKNQQLVKLFLSLLICTMVIFSSSYFGPKAIAVFKKENVQPTASVKVKKKPAIQPALVEQDVVINSATVNVKQIPDDIQALLSKNSKIEIPAQASFSLLGFLKQQKLEFLSADTLSMIGSGIYQAILPTNFTIEERNIGTELPAYAALGDEAKVDLSQKMDLAFSNPNNTKYTLELQLSGNRLTVYLKGAKLPNDYKITKKSQQKLTPETIVQYSPLVRPGQITIKDPGKNGQTIDVYRQTFKGDILVKSELVSNDYYPPEYRVEVHPLDSSAQAAGTVTDTTAQSSQQTTAVSSDQTSQTTTDGTTTTTNSTGASSTNDSSIYGIPNQQTK